MCAAALDWAVRVPDQGYALKLAERFADRLVLSPGERAADVLAGCCAIALRRASMLGRAPVSHDVGLALRLFGFLGEAVPELAALRRERFAGAAGHHGYDRRLRLAASIPEETLRRPASAVTDASSDNWRNALGL